MIAGQEKIVRAFAELMKNMARMKAFIRPSMVSIKTFLQALNKYE
jgi:hypothetical protein